MTSKLILFLTLITVCLLMTAGLKADIDSTSISDFRQEEQYDNRMRLERLHNVNMLKPSITPPDGHFCFR